MEGDTSRTEAAAASVTGMVMLGVSPATVVVATEAAEGGEAADADEGHAADGAK